MLLRLFSLMVNKLERCNPPASTYVVLPSITVAARYFLNPKTANKIEHVFHVNPTFFLPDSLLNFAAKLILAFSIEYEPKN